MPIKVTKTFLVDTDSVDEAYKLTTIENDKVSVIGIGQIAPMLVGPVPAGTTVMSRPVIQGGV